VGKRIIPITQTVSEEIDFLQTRLEIKPGKFGARHRKNSWMETLS